MRAFLSLLSLCFLSLLDSSLAVPILEARQSVSTLTAAQVASYKPYTHYAGAAYCSPSRTRAWNCGRNCDARPQFTPIASGGDGAITQYWYVGYDSALRTVVVAYQGTDPDKFFPLLTNANFDLKPLSSSLFPGVSSSVRTHDGFGDAHARSANAVLSAVRTGLSQYGTNSVTLVGHSLGGALATIATLHLSVNLPSSTTFRTVTYGMPRVGNEAFVNLVNSKSVMNRINNKDDLIPIVPGRFLGFAHTEGEIHIVNNGNWVNCPGQDNTNSQCTIGYVPNIFSGNLNDHGGPFDGVNTSC
ncbi:lipase [Coprinopsis cinerea okayama7|uniref:Lipase n=1 Tax=Coprinopsis cinerea (strain Okayama-7 / 130 / ATCC MYA-4618 / FGSC 9003) TaxID=240176 RepID=A8N8M4_COPC7|nr:lipase [Coprinopsis cinerea okayama7\|eukprot:XP_001831180.1 lipase [Coprinopsis cinerea okayama7\